MNQIFYLVFEFGAYLLAFLCLRRAWKQGRPAVLQLLAAIIYGICLEYAAILAYQAYSYGQFLIMIGNTVPLCIGAMWGVILFAAIETANRLEIPEFLRFGFAALLALSIDFSLDMIAIRLGFWTWRPSAARVSLWGVPLYNYYTWLLVAFSFALVSHLGKWVLRSGRWKTLGNWVVTLLTPPLAVLTLFGLFVGHGVLMNFFHNMDPFTVFLPVVVGGFAIAIVWFARKPRQNKPGDPLILAVPLFFHGFCVAALFLGGFYQQDPLLIVVIVVTLIVSMGLFVWPFRRKLFRA
jgi:uncharacterized membrane protein